MFSVFQVLFNAFLVVLVVSFLYVWIKTMLGLPFPWKPKAKGAKFPSLGLVVLLVSIAVVGSLTYFMSAHAREKVSRRLERLSEPYSVTIDGQPVSAPSPIIAALRFDDIPAHHSHPTKRIEIQIEDREGKLTLVLARDSERASEYWVYSPQDDFTKGLVEGHEIGRINTSALNSY